MLMPLWHYRPLISTSDTLRKQVSQVACITRVHQAHHYNLIPGGCEGCRSSMRTKLGEAPDGSCICPAAMCAGKLRCSAAACPTCSARVDGCACSDALGLCCVPVPDCIAGAPASSGSISS